MIYAPAVAATSLTATATATREISMRTSAGFSGLTFLPWPAAFAKSMAKKAEKEAGKKSATAWGYVVKTQYLASQFIREKMGPAGLFTSADSGQKQKPKPDPEQLPLPLAQQQQYQVDQKATNKIQWSNFYEIYFT